MKRLMPIALLVALLVASLAVPKASGVLAQSHTGAPALKKVCKTKKVHGKKTKVCVKAKAKPTPTSIQEARYTVVDVGTLGGPMSGTVQQNVVLTSQGVLGGYADTGTAQPSSVTRNPRWSDDTGAPPDGRTVHAAESQGGKLVDMGTLPGGDNSAVISMNARGDATGASETGTEDPQTHYQAVHAVLWRNGKILDLGTLPGGNESGGNAVNDQDQVAGFSSNGVPDRSSFAGWPTQTRAFLWSNGVMQDLGTLGGPDSLASSLNQSGQVAGWSYTNATANPGSGQLTVDPFLWSNGVMRDLGTLGGTGGAAFDVNNQGKVVGTSNLAGDQKHHAFLWNGTSMVNLGTLGGDDSEGWWLNEAGDVVGRADLKDGNHHAFLWRNGTMADLGTVAGAACTTAVSVNNRDQVVGDAGACGQGGTGWLWQNGTMYDLNTLVGSTTMHIAGCKFINDQGQITCEGVVSDGNVHAVILVSRS